MLQSRYGWSDEYILSLPYARYCQLVDTVINLRKDEEKLRDVRSAKEAWLTYVTRPRHSEKEKRMNLEKWLRVLNLGYTTQEDLQDDDEIRKQADINVNLAIAAFRGFKNAPN